MMSYGEKPSKIFFEPEGHFRTFFRKNFLSTMTSGKFYVDPEILSPQVKKGQVVIWSENNPTHDFDPCGIKFSEFSLLMRLNETSLLKEGND